MYALLYTFLFYFVISLFFSSFSMREHLYNRPFPSLIHILTYLHTYSTVPHHQAFQTCFSVILGVWEEDRYRYRSENFILSILQIFFLQFLIEMRKNMYAQKILYQCTLQYVHVTQLQSVVHHEISTFSVKKILAFETDNRYIFQTPCSWCSGNIKSLITYFIDPGRPFSAKH